MNIKILSLEEFKKLQDEVGYYGNSIDFFRKSVMGLSKTDYALGNEEFHIAAPQMEKIVSELKMDSHNWSKK